MIWVNLLLVLVLLMRLLYVEEVVVILVWMLRSQVLVVEVRKLNRSLLLANTVNHVK